jgi:hypothetical protein
METPAVNSVRLFASFAKREDFLNHHVCKLQVKLTVTGLGYNCFVKVGTEVYKCFSADHGEKLLFFGEFYSTKPEESVSVFFRDNNGKEIYDNPKKRTCKFSSEKGQKNPKYVACEWLWGLATPNLRLLYDEARQRPHDCSTAVVCFAFDPEELVVANNNNNDVTAGSMAGAGRGSGRDAAPGSPGTEAVAAGRGRGAPRKDTVDGAGRGRGAPNSPSLTRRPSMGSSSEMNDLATKRRPSGGSDKDANLLPKSFSLANSVVEASVNKYVELCNTQQDGSYSFFFCFLWFFLFFFVF